MFAEFGSVQFDLPGPCVVQTRAKGSEPLIQFGPNVTLWVSAEQVRELRDSATAWLDAQAGPSQEEQDRWNAMTPDEQKAELAAF